MLRSTIGKDSGNPLAKFCDRYIATRSDVQDTTRALLMRARDILVEFLGPDRQLKSITPGDADEFRRHVQAMMGENTARRVCGWAKQFFRAAARKKLIAESPFADMRGLKLRAVSSRQFYITREMADRVLDACPDTRWRLIFALSRFGGLRCPSEHLALHWSDVDWTANRLRVPSPKTAHHEGKAFRFIPLFPELRPYLVEAHELAGRPEDGSIIECRANPRRKPDSVWPHRQGINLGTRMQAIIRKAGLRPWPKTFQNLRSTRETELSNSYPLHVVCAWIGNSELVARDHYLQVTDEYFERAASGDGVDSIGRAKGGDS